MSIVAESLLDILHVGGATRQNDTAEQLVAILVGHLAPDISNDFLQTAFDNLNELTALYLTVLVDRELHVVVYLAILSICRAVLELHALCISFFHLQGSNIFRDIVAAKGNDCQVAQDVLIIDGDGRRVGTHIDQRTTGALLRLGQHAVRQSQRSEVQFCDVDIGSLETLVQVLIERLALQDIEEIALNARALDANRVNLILRIDLILLNGSVQNLLVGIGHAAVVIHEFHDHVLSDEGFAGQVLSNDIADRANRLTTYTNIHLSDGGLQLFLQLRDDTGQTLGGLVNVIDYTFTDKQGRVLLDTS